MWVEIMPMWVSQIISPLRLGPWKWDFLYCPRLSVLTNLSRPRRQETRVTSTHIRHYYSKPTEFIYICDSICICVCRLLPPRTLFTSILNRWKCLVNKTLHLFGTGFHYPRSQNRHESSLWVSNMQVQRTPILHMSSERCFRRHHKIHQLGQKKPSEPERSMF